jgi:hypothetical protein
MISVDLRFKTSISAAPTRKTRRPNDKRAATPLLVRGVSFAKTLGDPKLGCCNIVTAMILARDSLHSRSYPRIRSSAGTNWEIDQRDRIVELL